MGNRSQVTVAPWLKVLVCTLIFGQFLINGQDIEPVVNVTYIKDGVAKGAGNYSTYFPTVYYKYSMVINCL